MGPPPQLAPNTVTVADQNARILDLRRSGLPIREVARITGISKSVVHKRIGECLAELITPAATELRALELERLDAWQTRLEVLLNTPGEDTTRVVMALVRLSESRRKLLGLDAPVAVDAGGELLVTIVGVDVEAVK